MISLLVIADDFTGALDTGVQFAAAGAVVRVVTDIHYDYGNADETVQVLVMDAETRHLSSDESYRVVWDITKRAMANGISHLYKKTDSALRGNIGSELTALLDASGQDILPFLPAFPKMGRTTKDGIHYINNVPVEDSVFGKDLFEPVTRSYIPDIIRLQSEVPVELVAEDSPAKIPAAYRGILVYDAGTEENLIASARSLYQEGRLTIMAGCAGFASVLPDLLGLSGRKTVGALFLPGLLAACGSINPITRKQLDYAERHGFYRIRMKPEQMLDLSYWDTPQGHQAVRQWLAKCQANGNCILDSNDPAGSNETMEYAAAHGIELDEVRTRIAESMGIVLDLLLQGGLDHTLLITGGDTLLGFMKRIGVCEMEPLCEVAPGTVLSAFYMDTDRYQVISKSGGFGSEDLLVQLTEMIAEEKGRASC